MPLGSYKWSYFMTKVSAPYLFQKRGIFYLRKRIPKELIGQYGRALVKKSLRTSDRNLAVRLSSKIVDALEHEWRQKLFEIPPEQSALEFLTSYLAFEVAFLCFYIVLMGQCKAPFICLNGQIFGLDFWILS